MSNWLAAGLNRQTLEHAARTTIAATLSLSVARMFKLPEAQWAAISAMVVMQSTLGAAFTISGQRFAGTALGSAVAALLVTYVGSGMAAFALGIFGLGIVCAVLRLERPAYRFAGIALTIVMLVSREQSVWITAAHRFFEVSLGIAMGLAVTALWPEREGAA